ncbi:MAG: peptidylprolyl isomerase [Nannocystis sp.]|nr:peptidylprolyl isomerase [Nannocystis sp.]
MLAAVRTTVRGSAPPLPLLPAAALFVAVAGCVGAHAPLPFAPPLPALVAANEAAGDPYGGRFPMEEALADLPGQGPLIALLDTDAGTIRCRLEPETAPITVANFIGLARGLRPFQVEEDGPWTRANFYDDLPWHRAIEGQFVQTGRRGDRENPGFNLQDEISPGAKFDRPGALALANAGAPNSGAAQFFITSEALSHLNGAYTLFGACDSPHVVRELSRQVRARPSDPPRLRKVTITRG